jgi:hypothetical protein
MHLSRFLSRVLLRGSDIITEIQIVRTSCTHAMIISRVRVNRLSDKDRIGGFLDRLQPEPHTVSLRYKSQPPNTPLALENSIPAPE